MQSDSVVDTTMTSPDAEPERALSREWVFPVALPGWHLQLLSELTACCVVMDHFEPSFRALLEPELQWIHSLSGMEWPPADEGLSPAKMRRYLVKQRIVSQHYLVDTLLAELQIGKALNDKLFANLKSVTVLAALALTHINFQQGIMHDNTIEEALRNVRLFVDNRRDLMIKALSAVNFLQPIQQLLIAIREQRDQYSKNKKVVINTTALEALLNRLYQARRKDRKVGARSPGEKPKSRLEWHTELWIDDVTRIKILSEVSLRQGRYKARNWQIEEERSASHAVQTALVIGAQTGSMDIQARFLQCRSVAQSLSKRAQMLPANLAVATPEQIRRFVLALLKHAPAEGPHPVYWWLLQIVLGMSGQERERLPVWRSPSIKRSTAGHVFSKKLEYLNGNGIWLVSDGVWLQRFIEVANSRVHQELNRFLPPVTLFLLLPLPTWTSRLLETGLWSSFKAAELDEALKSANHRAGTELTRRQLQTYLMSWLLREGVDSAIIGILSGKTAQQCSPMAYSHVHQEQIIRIWTRYLAELGMEITAPSLQSSQAGQAVGSRFYPDLVHFKGLLTQYQHYLSSQVIAAQQGHVSLVQYHNLLVRHCLLILNLSTAARPVTEMYGRRQDYCLDLRLIRLTDKEARAVSSARMVPLSELAIQQLRIWEKHLDFLSRLRKPIYTVLAQAAREALDNRGALLFWVEAGDERGTLEIQPLAPSNMDVHFDSLFPFPSNWHRHAVRSHLLELQVQSDLIDALLGHEAMGFEYSHPCSGAPMSDLYQLVEILDRWHQSLGLEVLPGWKTR